MLNILTSPKLHIPIIPTFFPLKWGCKKKKWILRHPFGSTSFEVQACLCWAILGLKEEKWVQETHCKSQQRWCLPNSWGKRVRYHMPTSNPTSQGFSEMFFLVYSHSITTATELAQVLPRRKAFRGDLQPASERLPSIGWGFLGKGSVRKVLEQLQWGNY